MPKTLDSVKAQDYRPLQVVLVDNCSTDGSLEVCKAFARNESTDSFEIVVSTEHEPGAAATRNRGLSLCEADIVAFFDSDDEMSPDFISAMYGALTSNPLNDVAIGRTLMVFADGKERVRDYWPKATVAHQILAGIVTTVSFLTYKSFLYDIGCWNTAVRTWDDYELGVRILMYAHKVEWVERTFHRIHNHSASITGESFTATVDGVLGALRAVADDIDNYEKASDTNKRDVALMRRALFFRSMLLKGWLCQERNDRDAAKVGAFASTVKCSVFYRIAGWMICHITAHGVRGAWRLGRLFL